MRTLAVACLAASLVSASPLAIAASPASPPNSAPPPASRPASQPASRPASQPASAPRDVTVCVRIDEKSWTREGAAPPAPREKSPGAALAPSIPPSVNPPGSVVLSPEASGSEAPTDASSGGTQPSASPSVPGEPKASSPTRGVRESSDKEEALVDEDEADFFVVDPVLYLRRLIEYQVTHEPGFESVRTGCSQTIAVELYPVKHGWTAFARYSGTAREEKVDVVRLDELGTFAERVTTALLRDRTIAETLTRTTVLRADSEARVRQIRARTHFLLGMGSTIRVGNLPTAPDGNGPAVDKLRVETPLSFTVGVRNKFRAWALDAAGRLNVGLTQRSTRRYPGGGHVEFSTGLGVGLDFLAYAEPDAVNTLYYGGGGSFELTRYQTLGARDAKGVDPTPDGLWGGGLDVDLVLGYEFMRTSTLHFFVQTTAAIPAYAYDSENAQSRIRSYVPSANVQVGLLF